MSGPQGGKDGDKGKSKTQRVYNPEEPEAAQTLATVHLNPRDDRPGQTPQGRGSTFPNANTSTANQPSTSHQNVSASSGNRAAPSSHDNQATTHPAPVVEPVAQRNAITSAEVQAEVNGPLREFSAHVLMTTTFSARQYERAARMANALGGRVHLRDALIALDEADWDLGGAVQQHRFDVEDRHLAAQQPAPGTAGSDSNRDLDRRRASGGPNWNKGKLVLRMKKGKKLIVRDYRNVNKKFNVDEPTPMDILLLNKWRHDTIMENIGQRLPPQGKTAGEWWHPVTIRDLRRRFLNGKKHDPKFPNYHGLMKDHNGFFKGMFLPAEVKEVPQRTQSQVSNLIDRRYKRQKDTKGPTRIQRDKMAHEMKKEMAEEKKRCEATFEHDFSSDLKMLEAVEKEEEDEKSDVGEDSDEENSADGGDEDSSEGEFEL